MHLGGLENVRILLANLLQSSKSTSAIPGGL
jgi:hypothetical protein